MKKLSLLLVLAMLVSCISIPVLGEGTGKQVTAGDSTYFLVEAGGDQAELGYVDESIILEADGLNSSIYITVDTLSYLKKGGRITAAAAAIRARLNSLTGA